MIYVNRQEWDTPSSHSWPTNKISVISLIKHFFNYTPHHQDACIYTYMAFGMVAEILHPLL